MARRKTIQEINEKIKQGKAVVVTAEEVITIAREKGVRKAAAQVDVVTTGTFGPMCSSGAFLNFGHSRPRIKMQNVWLNGVRAYAGLAAVDAYIGATELRDDDPLNSSYPGQFLYGGGHVISDLVAGKEIELVATAYGTDCYPRKELRKTITIHDLSYVAWHGSQHSPDVPRGPNGVPKAPAGTLAVIGDLKGMSPDWLVGASFVGYGATLVVGVGIPIPILDEEILEYTAVRDEDIVAPVVDYSVDYPSNEPRILGEVTYAQLRAGTITVLGREVPTVPLSSYAKAREIANILKQWISQGKFTLTEPVQPLPGALDASPLGVCTGGTFDGGK